MVAGNDQSNFPPQKKIWVVEVGLASRLLVLGNKSLLIHSRYDRWSHGHLFCVSQSSSSMLHFRFAFAGDPGNVESVYSMIPLASHYRVLRETHGSVGLKALELWILMVCRKHPLLSRPISKVLMGEKCWLCFPYHAAVRLRTGLKREMLGFTALMDPIPIYFVSNVKSQIFPKGTKW